MTAELLIIIILLIYIGFLHFQLYKKNAFIELLIQKQLNIENVLSKEGLEELLKKLRGLTADVPVKPSKLFEKEIQDFILEQEPNRMLFIHYTKDEEVVQRIIREGFRFADSFYKTAEAITNDKLDLVYKHYLRKQFGRYVIIIAISKEVYNRYLNEITNTNKVLNVEQILSIRCSQLNENLDEVYQLPKQYIKGYINSETGDIVRNPDFDPYYDNPLFLENLKAFK